MRVLTFLLCIAAQYYIYSQPITLRDTTNQYDYIIITIPEFVSVCEPFKHHKETVRNFRTLIVDTTMIYSEFDSDFEPQDKIRNFISYAGTFWQDPKPKYFLIAGTVSAVPNFLVPFFQPPLAFNSDYYYGINLYGEDSTQTDFYIGRIPGKTPTEINSYFSKVIEYEKNDNLFSWMNNVVFVCEAESHYGFLNAALMMPDYLPPYINSHFIAHSDTSIFFGNRDSILSAINESGCAIAWFYGRGTDSFFISQEYFNINDLNFLNNQSKYFITIFLPTQNSIINNNTNIVKELLTMESAGSLGAFVNIGFQFWGIGESFRREWAKKFFQPDAIPLGEVFNLDKFPSTGSYLYAKKNINLWADPSLKLMYDFTLNVKDITTAIPDDFLLYQNYPNPFNPATKIKFEIPGQARNDISLVTLKVYDVLGKEVATLVNEYKPAGSYEVEFNAASLPSGVYFYRLTTEHFVDTKKLMLIK